MNIKIILLALTAFTFASCSSTYKNTQTPDDVYYSPARNIEKDTRQEQVKRYDPEEREIRMSAYDSRWRNLNNRYNYGYNLSPYEFDYGYNNYNPYYNSYSNYGGYHGYNNNYYGNSGYYYNPYYASYPIYIVTTTTPVNRTPRKVNLSGYGQNTNTRPISSINTVNSRNNNNSNTTNRTYNNSNNNNNSRSKSYTPSRSETQNRTYNPPSNNSSNNSSGRSSSGSSNSGSSSGGSVERPTRGNN